MSHHDLNSAGVRAQLSMSPFELLPMTDEDQLRLHKVLVTQPRKLLLCRLAFLGLLACLLGLLPRSQELAQEQLRNAGLVCLGLLGLGLCLTYLRKPTLAKQSSQATGLQKQRFVTQVTATQHSPHQAEDAPEAEHRVYLEGVSLPLTLPSSQLPQVGDKLLLEREPSSGVFLRVEHRDSRQVLYQG